MTKLDNILLLLERFERAVEERAEFIAAGWERDENHRTQQELKEAREKLVDTLKRALE